MIANIMQEHQRKFDCITRGEEKSDNRTRRSNVSCVSFRDALRTETERMRRQLAVNIGNIVLKDVRDYRGKVVAVAKIADVVVSPEMCTFHVHRLIVDVESIIYFSVADMLLKAAQSRPVKANEFCLTIIDERGLSLVAYIKRNRLYKTPVRQQEEIAISKSKVDSDNILCKNCRRISSKFVKNYVARKMASRKKMFNGPPAQSC